MGSFLYLVCYTFCTLLSLYSSFLLLTNKPHPSPALLKSLLRPCLHDTDRSVVVVILCLMSSCSLPCSISCLLMPRNSHKKRLLDPNKSQLLFVEAPINGPKHEYGPQLRSAIHPKSFISEKQQRSGAPCSSWVCACFAWCEDERRCFNWN